MEFRVSLFNKWYPCFGRISRALGEVQAFVAPPSRGIEYIFFVVIKSLLSGSQLFPFRDGAVDVWSI